MPPSSRVASLASTYLTARAERQRANDAFDAAQQELVDALQGAGLTSYEHGDGDDKRRLTVVAGTTVEWDEAKLEQLLSERTWRDVTVRRVDRKLLDAAIAMRRVADVVVRDCRTDKPKTPYVKVTRAA